MVIPLGTGARDGVVTPDGRYLLLAAGNLIVVDLKPLEIDDSVSVGNNAKTVIVNRASTFAYVIGGIRSQRRIHAVDLETFELVAETPATDGLSDMVLVEGESLMVAAADSRMVLFSPGDLTKINDFEPSPNFSEPEIDLIPGGTRVLVRGTGLQSSNASIIFDWTSGNSRIIAPSTDNLFSDVAVLDGSTTFAVRSSDNKVVLLDTTEPLQVTVVPLNLGVKAKDLGLSPDHQQLYVAAEDQNQILKYDAHTLSPMGEADLEAAPGSLEMLFVPGDLPPGSLITLSGDHQYGIPNTQLEFPFSVQLRDILEQPVLGQDVLFEDLSGLGFQFTPSNLVKTNDQGIASVTVKVAPRAAFGTPAENFQEIILSATAPNVRPVFFDVRVAHQLGIKAVTGDDQIVGSTQELPKRLVVSAVRANGNPVAAGTVLPPASWQGGACIGDTAVNSAGFASVQCRASPLPAGQTQRPGTITLTALQFAGELGTENVIQPFNFTAFSGANWVDIEQLSGDGQSASPGVPLLAPLSYQITNEATNVLIPVTVEASRLEGPPVAVSPRYSSAFPEVQRQIAATTGKYSGTAVVQVEAAAPGLAKTFFTIEILPETPSFLTKKNDGQEGKILTTLASPLEVAVFGQSGKVIPFPVIEWDVLSGSATTSALTTSTGSKATVKFGPLAGPVVIQASVGELTAVFNLEALGPEPDQITLLSGQGQSLTAGVVSEPVSVLLFEDGEPAAGSIVTFSGPPTLVFHPLGAGNPANPFVTNADLDGRAVARVELVPVQGLTEQGAQQQTTSEMVTATISAGTVSRDVLFGVIGRTPQFTTSSLVNAASFRPGIVPGGLGTLFGSGLMEAISEIVLPSGVTSFNGTTILIDGIPAPLLAFSPGSLEQINFQVPFEITPGQLVSVEVENNGTKTTVQNVAVFSVQPGIFEVPQGQENIGAVLHADDGSLVTAANPADPGEALSLYFTGGGALDDPGAGTGELGPTDPPLTTAGLTEVLVGGVETEGLFSGYAPFFMGLYQTNFVVPPDITCGPQSLAVVVSATPSPASMINIACQ
ncbi:MAG: hypothetical protein O3A53_06755 [Acidobacteria bacterium]|nr:hypothetical protein [Acidobacteriota bacterium]